MKLQNKLITYILISICIITKAQSQDRALAIADSLYAIGSYTNAIKAYNSSSYKNNRLLKIAKAYEALGQTNSALKYYKSFIKDNPKSTTAILAYAKLLISKNDFKTADSLLLSIYDANKDNPNIPYQLGISKDSQKDSSATQHFEQTLKIDSTHTNAKYRLAKFYVVKRKFNRAEPLITSYLSNNPDDVRFLNLQALQYFHQENYHDAIVHYNKLQALGEHTEQLYKNLAVCYSKTYQYNKLISVYKELLNTYDNQNGSWHYGLGRAYFFEGKIDEAQKHINLALLILDQPLDDYYLNFAMTYVEQQNYAEAIKFLKIAIEENSENKMAYYQLAVAADNYYEDKNAVLNMYQRYIDKFGTETNLSILVKRRMSDLKKEQHFNATEKDN
ncbi:tetratricopeptide repeat protein [Croceibacter atlanticus]|uniref:tetratricopeptide repeat protein n=1 Tax=Croceibacter atlanticus TaxID=313588 RepID=UPI0032B19B97